MRFIVLLTFLSVMVSPLVVSGHGGETHIELLPSSMAYQAGEEITVVVMLHTVEAATSVRIHLSYDVNSLQIKEIKQNTDDFPFWWKQEGSSGLIELEASSPTPGFQGEATVATIIFEAVRSGSSEVVMLADTSLVLNVADQNILVAEEFIESPEGIQAGPPQSVGLGGEQQSASSGVNIGIIIAIAVTAVVIGGGVIFFLKQKK